MGQVMSDLERTGDWTSNAAANGSLGWGWTTIGLAVGLALIILCHLGDIALMVRFIWICSVAPSLGLAPNKPNRVAFLKEHVHRATVTTRDMDLMFHMNNARYLREADFARHELLVECGLFQAAWKRKTPFVTASQTIRYRKELKFRTQYRILTSIVGWDEKCVIIQQVFVTSGRSHKHHHHDPAAGGKVESGDVVHAVLIVREGMAGGGRAHHHPTAPHHHDDTKDQNRSPVNPLSAPAPTRSSTDSQLEQQQAAHGSGGGPFRSLLESLGWNKDSADGQHKALPLAKNPPTDVMEWLHSTLETSARVVDGGK